jgi:Zn-dependent protease
VSSPVEGGRPLLRLRLFGFPVHLDFSFVIIMGILGYYPADTQQETIRNLVIWLLITPFAVLSHELGHAFAARAAGAGTPEIALAGFGGVTSYSTPGPLSRARSLGISLAGPAVGLVLGSVLWAVYLGVSDDFASSDWRDQALRIGIFTCLGWSVLNLLPVLPLDGGQAMRELLPGSPQVRTQRAAAVSVVVAAIVAVVAYTQFGQPFIALFMAFFAVSNVLALRESGWSLGGTGGGGGARRGPVGPVTPERAVVDLLWRSEPAQARRLLESVPPGTPVDVAVHGAVLALTGDREQGHALIGQELERRPGDPNVVSLLILTLTLEHDWDGLINRLQGPLGPSVPPPLVERAILEARGTGREDVAGRLTLLSNRAN